MKELSTLLQNAVEDYLKQLDTVEITHMEEVCTFNLSDIAWKALSVIQDFKNTTNAISQEKALDILKRFAQTLIGFPVGENINAIANIMATALKYGYSMFYGINEEPYICYRLQHTDKDNNKIKAVGFDKIKK